jgi:uracil-DNA glycosylase
LKTGKGTGKSPAFKEKAFIKDCQDFFLKQLEAQKPKIILVLGKHVAEFIAPLSEELKFWGKIKNFEHVDSQNQQVINTTFTNDLNTTTVLLTHPSFRFANVGRRKFNSLEGNIAELEMIKTALKIT